MGASRLRERRLQTGLTQAQLAARAGVSRQLIAAVEAGRNAPAVDAALGISRALGTTVEALFSACTDRPFEPMFGRPLREGAQLRVGEIGDRLVAVELPDHGAAGVWWGKADGVCEAGAPHLFPGTIPSGTVLAGCEPAFGVAERMLEGLGPQSLLAASAPTGIALAALRAGRVHAAVVHGPDSELPPAPVPVSRWHVASWPVGLGFASSLAEGSLESLLSSGVPVAQRDPAAASQQAFERVRAADGLTGDVEGPIVAGHLDAARTAAVLGGAAVTTEAAARAFGLRFLALEEHVVELWVAERWHQHAGVEALAELLCSAAFKQRIAQYGGYDLTQCGARVSPAN